MYALEIHNGIGQNAQGRQKQFFQDEKLQRSNFIDVSTCKIGLKVEHQLILTYVI